MPAPPPPLRSTGKSSLFSLSFRGHAVTRSALLSPAERLSSGMYRLTRQLFPTRPDFAALATVSFLLAPSRPTLHAVPYTEPFASLFTFLGMSLFVRDQNFSASVAWAVGSLFRAQGVILGVGFFGWRYLLRGVWRDGPGFTARHIKAGGPAAS